MRFLHRRFNLTTGLFVVVGLVALSVSAFTGMGAASSAHAAVATPFTVTFSESGLPSGTNWSVHVDYIGCSCQGVHKTVKSDLSTLTIPITHGPYRYTVLLVPGYYVVGSAHGTFNVSGANVSGISFVFRPVVSYVTDFDESGLPSGTLWTASVTGNATGQLRLYEDQTRSSNATTITFSLPNGTYHYRVAPVPGSFFVGHSAQGTFGVAGTSPSPIAVAFTTPALFSVVVTESGLALGTNWSVRVWGWGGVFIQETLSSTTNTSTFHLPNGTYWYVVAEVLGYNVHAPASGRFSVANSPVNLGVTFVPVAPGAFYPVAFQESGLPGGTHWAVLVTATHTFGHSRQATQSSTSTTLYFLLQNGTYRYQVLGLRGYTIVSGKSGEFNISGSSPSVFLVTFQAVPTYAVTFVETGLVNATDWSVLLRSQTEHSTPWPIHVVQTASLTTISFNAPNGTYCFKIYPVPGYTLPAASATGSITVAGSAPPETSVTFTPDV
jgi:hypothetical protein